MFTMSMENAADPEKWTLLEGTDDIWVYYKECRDVGVIVCDEGESLILKEDPDILIFECVEAQMDAVFGQKTLG